MKNTIDELIVYSVTDSAIALMKSEYMGLVVKGIDDKEGYLICKEARTEVRNKRIEVESKRKELKADSLDFGRNVDAEAKRITDQLYVMENHLKVQLDVTDNEIRRKKEEKELKEKAELDRCVALLQSVKATFTISELASMSVEEFDALYFTSKTIFDTAEKTRIENEAKIKKLEAEQNIQAETLRKLDEENKKMTAELLKKQQGEIDAKNAVIEKERKEQADKDAKREADEAARKAVETKRLAAEVEAKRLIDVEKKRLNDEAQKQIADEELFEAIKKEFPTVESAWVEIARLRKVAK